MLPKSIKQFYQYRQALFLLIFRDITSRYKGSYIGVLWLVIQPVLLVCLYTFVFSVVLKVKLGQSDSSYMFPLYLITGLIPFFAFQEAVLQASNSLHANNTLLSKSTMPPAIFPLVSVLASVVSEVVGTIIVVIGVWLFLGRLSPTILMLPLLILVRLLFSMGIGWMVSILTVFVKDLQQLLGLFLTMLLFLTPIFYPASSMPEQFQVVNRLNPFFHLLEAYRSVIIHGVLPDQSIYFLLFVMGSVAILGLYFFDLTIERAKEFL